MRVRAPVRGPQFLQLELIRPLRDRAPTGLQSVEHRNSLTVLIAQLYLAPLGLL
jgi:hypothetical protein